MRRRVACLLLVLASCGGGDDEVAACAPVRPDEVRTDAPTPDDLAEVLPRQRSAGDDRPARSWGDLDGDGDDELLVEDAVGAVRVEPGGARVPDELTFVWHDDLDGRPGEDVAVPDRAPDRTAVWSGPTILRGEADPARPDLTLVGLPRAVARLEDGGPRETLLLVSDPPTVRFVEPLRPDLRLGGEPAREVEHVLVFEGEDGERRIGLRIDRRLAVWRVPPRC